MKLKLGKSQVWVIHHFNLVWFQAPPTSRTDDKKDDDEEGAMPPYEQETQTLIDGTCLQPSSPAVTSDLLW